MKTVQPRDYSLSTFLFNMSFTLIQIFKQDIVKDKVCTSITFLLPTKMGYCSG